MPLLDEFVLKLKRGEGPFFRAAGGLARAIAQPRTPVFPGFMKPVLRALYVLHFGIISFFQTAVRVLYSQPAWQGRCASIGKNVSIDGLPYVEGHAEIHVGNDVWLGGKISVVSGRFLDKPQLIIKDRAQISWNVMITVNREVVIEEDARISFDCRISDSDGHPREADLRAANAPVSLRDIRAVRIGRNAWIGNGAHIMKGVTIGEGAIIGANSVVINDVPPFCLALGNPAEVYFQNYGRPSKRKAGPVAGS